MDVFFFISSLATIILTILLIILLVYLISFARDLKFISGKAKIEAENLAKDLSDLRQSIKRQGFKIKNLAKFFINILKRNKKGK
jgi:uncharacterized protein YpmB